MTSTLRTACRGATAVSMCLAAAPVLAQPRPRCSAEGLDGATYGSLLSRRFTSLVGPETEGVPSTYLSVNIKDAQATVGTAFVSQSGLIFSVTASGGVNDGAVAIFNDATLAGKFGATAQLHTLGGAKRRLEYDAASCDAMEAALRAADAKHALRTAEIGQHAAAVQRRIDSIALSLVEARIRERLRLLRDSAARRDLTKLELHSRDSLWVDSARVAIRIATLESSPPSTGETEESELLAVGNERARAYADAVKLIDLRGYRFSWWSLGASLENASFNLFDATASVADQLSKRTHLTRAVSLTFSQIRSANRDFYTRYLTAGIRLGWENNLTDLKKVEVRDRTQYAPPPVERVIEKVTTAYEGAYRDDIESIRVSGDLYKFFLPNDRLAYHVFPAYSARSGAIGQVDLGVGLLLSARNLAKKTSVANAEVFLNAPDLVDVRKTKKSALRRSTLGIRVTFPFAFTLGQ